MSKITRPMLASKAGSTFQFPLLCTEKLDGIRCLIIDGHAVTRNFKPIPNEFVRNCLEGLPDGLDGELIVEGGFNKTSSSIMSFEGKPNFTYHVFDYVKNDLEKEYSKRIDDLLELRLECKYKFIQLVTPIFAGNERELFALEKRFVEQGYEGIMMRDPNGPYKCGRSTVKENWLLKLKRFHDDEAIITGFQEMLLNQNEKEKDAFGLSERSQKKEGMVPSGILGSFLVKSLDGKREFKVATGLNAAMRKEVWNNKEKYIGKIIKYKYQELTPDNMPRFPSFHGFRSLEDM